MKSNDTLLLAMDFKEARDLATAPLKGMHGCICRDDGTIVVGADGQHVEVHVRESSGAIEMFSKLVGIEGSGFFKHIKLACMTAEQAEEAGKSIANFCSSMLEKSEKDKR